MLFDYLCSLRNRQNDVSFMIYARQGPHEEKTGRKKDNILEKLTVFQKNGQLNHVFWKQGVPGGPYEAKAAKLFARGTRSLECCKNEKKRVKKSTFARPGAHFCPWVYARKLSVGTVLYESCCQSWELCNCTCSRFEGGEIKKDKEVRNFLLAIDFFNSAHVFASFNEVHWALPCLT